jgi:two-component system cell cycle sensor histidine kinase/response regulator CckA
MMIMTDSDKGPENLRENASNQSLESAMADAALDAIFVVDEQAKILRANRSAFTLFGYSYGELLGQSVTELIAPRGRERVTRSIVHNLLTAQAHFQWKATECVALHKTGRAIPVEILLRPVHGSKNPHFIGVVRDLTERRKAEEEIQQVQEALRQSQKMKAVGQLSAGLAHDFNNLLAVIIGFSDLLLQQFPEQDATWRRKVEEIKKAGKRAAELTSQLLAFARQQVLQPKALGLNDVVSESCRMLDGLLGKDIELVLNLDPRPGQILADTHQVEQVIINLALNARDAMPKGGKLSIATANIEVDEPEAQRRFPMAAGSYVLIVVSDTGVGMDKGTQARLFEPFFTTKELGQGTGLGLASVYGIVKQSGGFIWVESEPGRGTSFAIYFPRF